MLVILGFEGFWFLLYKKCFTLLMYSSKVYPQIKRLIYLEDFVANSNIYC